MRVLRVARDVHLIPKKGDRWIDVYDAIRNAGDKVGHDWTLEVTTTGRWVFVPPKPAENPER